MVNSDAGVIPIRYKVFLALLSVGLLAACSVSPAKFEGTLLFHNYSSYDGWDGQLYTLDLTSKKLTNLTAAWKTVKHTINGSFSPDGKYITFMGSEKPIEDWDVFVTHWNGKVWEEPINLTGPNGKRDEDPKFGLNNQIIFKENEIVGITAIAGTPKYFKSGSMPYLLPNGKDYLFERNGDIFLNKNGAEIKMFAGDGLKSYYPIALNDKEFIYTRVQNSRHDGIMLGNYSGAPSKPYFFNNDQWDSSDPFPYKNGTKYIFLVTGDYSIPKGGYNLAIADLKAKKIIDIDSIYGNINTDLEELGPNWTPHIFK